ncbi:MAG: AmmeMemoRadiSam system protein A [Alphaproteobacteria bacterium]|nr:AmmeMemoRadiSam system protein A [Alphaproteobacteria bacterium]
MLSHLFAKRKQPQNKKGSNDNYYTAEEKSILLGLARQSIEYTVNKGGMLPVNADDFNEKLHEKRGVFVTLQCGGALRGCIGNITPVGPLYKTIVDRACDAAKNDIRFIPVELSELSKIHIEISVLTNPEALDYKTPEDLRVKLCPNIDGVVLQLEGGMSSTFLPQVWEQLPDAESFLAELSLKAGGSADDWKRPGVRVKTYQVEKFEE